MISHTFSNSSLFSPLLSMLFCYPFIFLQLILIQGRGVYRVLVGKPEGKRPMGRLKRRWTDNLEADLQEVGCMGMDWVGLVQDRDRWRTLENAVMNLQVP
jgi:hypothetical protein